MAENSKIEWTDATWNPVLGCDKISPGCKNCYAIRTAWRLQHNPNPKVAKAFEGLTVIEGGKPNWTGRVNVVEERLGEPLSWAKPRRVFVNSQSDLFHDAIPEESIRAVFAIMAQARQHTFQILTKRPARMQEMLSRWQSEGLMLREGCGVSLPNVWLGVSVENQKAADERIPLLLQTPAAVRWVSAEPLLGPITFRWASWDHHQPHPRRVKQLPDVERGGKLISGAVDHLDGLRMLDWVVAGGESGPGARPMHPDWARSLRNECEDAGVSFFFKQWGEWINIGSNPFQPKEFTWLNVDGRNTRDDNAIVTNQGWQCMARVGKKAAGRLLDGVEHNEFPQPAEVTDAH